MVFALAAGRPAFAAAEDIFVEASVTANRISLKDAAQLVLTIHGAKGDNGPLQLPKIEGLDTQYLGPSTRISIVNGRYSSEHSFTYNLFPSKTGHIQIPALTVSIGGKEYSTKPIDLQVESAPAPSGVPSQSGDAPTAESLKDHIFLQVSVTKAKVYFGERLPLRMKLLINDLPVRNIQFPQLEKNGFTVEEMAQPRQYTQILRGVKYDVVDFETTIYPTRTGEISIGPVQIGGNLLYKAQRQAPSGSGFFNDDFFNSIFDNYQQRPLTLTSPAIKINVLPLPEEGKPAGFSGGVGRLEFSASAGPSEVKVGDPVTLRMKISGQGNFKAIQMPVFNDPRFKTYDPKIKDESDGKVLEQVIIPTDAAVNEVPALQFIYFDPEAGQYKTAVQGPFPLKVLPASSGEEFKAVGFSELPQTAAAEPVDYVNTYIKQPFQKMRAVLKTPQFWLAAFLVGLAWVLWMGWSFFQQRLATDQSFARRLHALKNARQGMAQSQAHLGAGRSKEFYDSLARTLSTYLGDQFNKPAAAMTWVTVRPLLEQKQLPPEVVANVGDMYEACDLVRFAGGRVDTSRMAQDFAKLQLLVPTLEKYLK